MSETLGKFVIDLEARVEKLESDLGRAARLSQRRAQEMQSAFESAAKNILGTFGGLAAGLGAGIGVGAFAGFVKSSIDAQDHADELAQKIGITTEAASRLAVAARFSATDLGGVSAAMVKLNKAASDAAQGVAAPSNAFRAMGVSVRDASGQIKTSDVLIDEIGKKFAGWEDGVNKTAIALALFGKSGAEIVPMLNDWNGNVAEAIKLADEFGLTVSSKTGAAAAAFNDNLAKLGLVAQGVGNQIAASLVPALNDLAVKAIEFFRSDSWKSTLASIASGAKLVADNIDKIIAATKLLGTIAVTVYAGSLIKNGLQYAFTLAQQLSGINKLIVAQGEWGKATAASFQTAYKNIGALGIAFNVVGSAMVGWQIGTYLREQFRIVADAGDYLVYGIAQGWEEMKRAANVAWEGIKFVAMGAIDAILEGFASLIRWIAKSADIEVFGQRLFAGATDGLADLANGMSAAITPLDDFKASVGGIQAEYEKNSAANAAMLADMQGATAATFAAKESTKGASDALGLLAANAKGAAPELRDFAGAGKESEKAAAKLADLLAKDAETIAKLRGELNPLAKIQQDYVGKIIEAQQAYADELEAAKKSGATSSQLASIKANLVEKTNLAQQALSKESAELLKQGDVVGQYLTKIADDRALVGLTENQREVAIALQDATKRWNELTPAVRAYEVEMGKIDPTTEKGRQAIVAATTALQDHKAATEADKEIARGWAQIWQNAGSSVSRIFTDVLMNGASLFGGLKDLAKNTVAQIIDYFSQLAIINPILNSIFGGSMIAGGGSLLPTLAGGLFGGGGTGGGVAAVAGQEGTFSLMSPGTWLSAGQKLWSGFSSGLARFWSGSSGSVMNLGGGRVNLPGVGSAGYNPAYGGYGSPWAQGLGVAAGAYAGYSRYQDRYNTVSGLAGGAAYGLGTYAAGAGLASAAAGGGFAAGVSGAFTAIPVVGWVALAAMLIDKFTGGSLFGTSANKFQRGESNLSVGPGGGAISIGADFKGRKPLFGGSYHEWKNIAPTQEQTDAANGFYKALLDQSTDFAKKFGETAGIVASGTFRSEFDKKGNVTSTTSIVNGVEYKGETQEQFAARILAESFTSTLKNIGVDITGYTAQFIKDAETYAQAVQDAANAMQLAKQDMKDGIDVGGGKGLQGTFDTTLKYRDGSDSLSDTYSRLAQEAFDLKEGIKLLTGQSTIESIEAFIRESQRVGESLAQTYTRLQQASQQYRSFMAQFEPAATYVDDFEASLSGVRAQLLANIKTANDLAKAAGLERASTADLVKIHAAAAKQFAALLQQLKDSARGLAYQMGLIGPYTLDQVDKEIADLQAKANGGAGAIGDFGRAITETATRANDALNLLLGDLSPLNDEQKLQRALQGLREGDVTQEQVLQIGRRLYASSQKYNDLFRVVQQYAPRPQGGSSVGSGVPGNSATGGLSAADLKRLEELQKQREALLKAQDYANAQTLAKQIAEISAASGDDFEEILKEWGASADDLAKRLNLENEDQLRTYIENQRKLLDSNGENTTIIADLLRKILDSINRQGLETRNPGGRNGRVGTMTAEDADMIGEAVERHRDRRAPPLLVGNRRNERAYSP